MFTLTQRGVDEFHRRCWKTHDIHGNVPRELQENHTYLKLYSFTQCADINRNMYYDRQMDINVTLKNAGFLNRLAAGDDRVC